jgi:hypothetical protein
MKTLSKNRSRVKGPSKCLLHIALAVARTTEHGAEFAYSSFPSSASADHKTRSFPSSKYRFFLIREKSKLLLRICHVSSVSKGFCCTSQRQWQWQSLVNSRARDSSPTASLPTYLGISILAFTVEHYRIWLILRELNINTFVLLLKKRSFESNSLYCDPESFDDS